MKTIRHPGISALAMAALILATAGCELNEDDDKWVAPPDINGTWEPEEGWDNDENYDLQIVIWQDGTNARVTYIYNCTQICRSSRVTYPATYDLSIGLLTVYYNLNCVVEYYRFLSDTRMRRVSDPTTGGIHGIPYQKL